MYLFGKPKHQGSALLIGMWLIIVLTIIGIVFLEKIWRFSERTENIQQSNAAYYLATAGIEQAMYTTDKRNPWTITTIGTGTIQKFGYTGTATPLTTLVPRAGNGNSEFDSDWNILSLGEPVQIVIPNGVIWNSVFFKFRVPDFNRNGALTEEKIELPLSTGMVNWVIASSSEALFASGETEVFSVNDICDQDTPSCNNTIQNFNGNTSSGTHMTFDTFYTSPSNLNALDGATGHCLNFGCTLKLSLLRPLLVSGQSVPFLEYQIDFQGSAGIGAGIPDQYINLKTEGNSFGFLRSRTVQIPQITTNTALDFTVLQ